MKRSTSRILTTYTGSLPRSPELQERFHCIVDNAIVGGVAVDSQS